MRHGLGYLSHGTQGRDLFEWKLPRRRHPEVCSCVSGAVRRFNVVTRFLVDPKIKSKGVVWSERCKSTMRDFLSGTVDPHTKAFYTPGIRMDCTSSRYLFNHVAANRARS